VIFRRPPARLSATICRSISSSAGSSIGSSSRNAPVRAVLLSWPAVMIPSQVDGQGADGLADALGAISRRPVRVAACGRSGQSRRKSGSLGSTAVSIWAFCSRPA
jgi:hypothetical protein